MRLLGLCCSIWWEKETHTVWSFHWKRQNPCRPSCTCFSLFMLLENFWHLHALMWLCPRDGRTQCQWGRAWLIVRWKRVCIMVRNHATSLWVYTIQCMIVHTLLPRQLFYKSDSYQKLNGRHHGPWLSNMMSNCPTWCPNCPTWCPSCPTWCPNLHVHLMSVTSMCFILLV